MCAILTMILSFHQFDNLLRDITLYLTSTGSTKTIEGLLQKLSNAFSTPTGDDSMLRNEERLWQSSLENFSSRIREEYPAYRDLWFGFSVGVTGLCYGMRLGRSFPAVQTAETVPGDSYIAWPVTEGKEYYDVT